MNPKSSKSNESRRVSLTIIALCLCSSIMIIAIVIPIINLYSPNIAYIRPTNNNQTNPCQLSFASMIRVITRPGPAFVVTSDFNNDGHLDLAVANSDNSTTSILIGDGRGNFSQNILSNGEFAAPNTIAVGDINNDGNIDVLVVNSFSSSVNIFLGNGNGSFTSQTSISTGPITTPYGLALADLNRDNKLDLIISESVNYNVIIFLGIGNGTFNRTSTLFTGDLSRPYSVITADLNRDNFLDIIVSNIGTNNIGVFIGDGTGNFGAQTTYATDANPYRVIAVDFNRDGKIDAATTNFFGNSISILLGNGNGTFNSQISISTGNGSSSFGLFSGDFNRDTIPDLVVANPNFNSIAVFIGNGNGGFNRTLNYSTANNSYPNDVTIGDFNEDGRLDIVTANYRTESIGLLLNTCV